MPCFILHLLDNKLAMFFDKQLVRYDNDKIPLIENTVLFTSTTSDVVYTCLLKEENEYFYESKGDSDQNFPFY